MNKEREKSNQMYEIRDSASEKKICSFFCVCGSATEKIKSKDKKKW